MPLEQRVVEPITASRGTLPLDSHGNLAINIPNELECVTNGTLANVIRQLSSLSDYAEDLFGGILREASVMVVRSTTLQGRIDRLAVKVTQLDSSVEEVSLHDIHLRKPFKSSTCYDQQVVARSTIPSSLLEQYKQCDIPPPLNDLNPYRDDTREGLTFYTDPNYFFNLWREDMLRETEREKSGRKGPKGPARSQNGGVPGAVKDRQKKPRQPTNTREKYRQAVPQQELMDTSKGQVGHGAPVYSMDQNGSIYSSGYGTLPTRRPSSLEISQYMHESGQYGQFGQPPAYIATYGTIGHNHGHPNNQQNSHLAQQQQHNNHIALNKHHSLPSPTHVGGPGGQGAPVYGQSPSQDMAAHNSQLSQSGGTPTKRAGSIAMGSRPSQAPPPPPSNPSSSNSSGHATPTAGTPNRSRGPSLTRDILPPPPPPPMPGPGDHGMMNGGHDRDSIDLPLPPLPNQQLQQHQIMVTKGNSIPGMVLKPMGPAPPLPQSSSSINSMPVASSIPPPPPPPMNGFGDSSSNSTKPSFAQQILLGQKQLQPPKMSTMNKVLPGVNQQHVDSRCGLLAAIREGIKLRRVEDTKQKEVDKVAPCNDVASILARRVAMELSDSDSDGGSAESGADWDDESEC